MAKGSFERTRMVLETDWPGRTLPKLMIDGVTATALWIFATTEIGIVGLPWSLVRSVISSLK